MTEAIDVAVIVASVEATPVVEGLCMTFSSSDASTLNPNCYQRTANIACLRS